MAGVDKKTYLELLAFAALCVHTGNMLTILTVMLWALIFKRAGWTRR